MYLYIYRDRKNVFQNIWEKNDLKTKIALISVIFVPLSMWMFECMAVKVLSVIAYVYQILYIAVDVKNITLKKSSLMSAVVLLGYTMAMVTAFSVCEMSVMNYPKIWETDNNLIFYMRILLITQTSHTENIPYALINQLELNVESHSRTLLCTQTTHPKSGQIVQESFQERFDQQDF